ncbi:MFS transporter [Lignipirellula cremea]|uniref:Tetracycline resistance protein, class C n=1 Tax=Lignipirellula cremea TaxID=2528010 RepID=A0A518DYJ0_9BACT|nr:MFS transporter [Lignipirellula cremea]QDU96908.1 Tetracycline resistance protein, class C [Lignipirellula cremea]
MTTSSSSSAGASTRKGSLLVIFVTVFIDLLGFGLVLPLLPLYATQFSTDDSGIMIGLLMASFSIMQFFFAPLWGRLSDRIGRRPVLMVGLAGSVVFYALFGVAAMVADDPSRVQLGLILLFVSRIGAGIAGATISTAQAYIADTTTLETRPKGMALIGMAFGLGFTFGPLLGFLAVPSGEGNPGPEPGFVAAGLSLVGLVLAYLMLPESLQPDSEKAGKKIFDWQAFRMAMSTPSIALILLALFVCVFSFANFETTLSLLMKGYDKAPESPFKFEWRTICLTYAYIGFTLALVQGGLVRRLAGRMNEGVLAASGALIQVCGFGLLLLAIDWESWQVFYVALAVVVTGFSFMQPMLNSLLSRRSDPEQQGAILGVGQSVSSLARIFGSGMGIPLLMSGIRLPYYTATGLMAVGLVLVILAARAGKDYSAEVSR